MAANYGMGTNHTTTATSLNFIPELWSDEVIGAYKSNLVLANLVTKLSHKGKKGDAINIPVPGRGAASKKDASKQVHLIADTAGTIKVSIDKHYEYSKLIEDIAETQALASMRKFYTEDAGYALATQVESDLFAALVTGFGTATQITAETAEKLYVKGDGTTWASGAGGVISDDGIRKMILGLDEDDVPMDSRALVIPPSASSTLLGLPRFTEQAFIGDASALKTGKIGMIYGLDVYVTNSCPKDNTNSEAFMFHKDAAVLAEQVGVRTQTQYKQEYLGDLFTADTIYGVAQLRLESVKVMKVTV